jgi:hypothetical protein
MKRCLLVFFVLLVAAAWADLGPKPTMDFYLDKGTKVTITSGSLLQSKNADGSESSPLAALGPQRFTCDSTHCFAMAYGFAPYQRLSLKFSDGKTRRSNVFVSSGMNSIYLVTVRDNDLVVKATEKVPSWALNRNAVFRPKPKP